MTNFNDLYKEIVPESNISKYSSDINYKLKYLPIIEKYELVYNKNTKRFDCDNGIDCKKDLVKYGKLIIPFGVINGYFSCAKIRLTTLENCPEIVNGNFYCYGNQLTSLEYCPKIVHGNFDCSHNQLTSLEHCPKEVHGDFYCYDNQLTSLEYCPKIIYGTFDCSHNNITDFSINCKIKDNFYHD